MKFFQATIFLYSLVALVDADRLRRGHKHSRNVDYDCMSSRQIVYYFKAPESILPIDPDKPYQTPGDQAIYADDLYESPNSKDKSIGKVYGYCILTEPVEPGKESGSAFCHSTYQIYGVGSFNSAGVVFNPAGLALGQPPASGTQAITGGTGHFLNAQGTVETVQQDQEWLKETATFSCANVYMSSTTVIAHHKKGGWK
jgi:hypothetical protein